MIAVEHLLPIFDHFMEKEIYGYRWNRKKAIITMCNNIFYALIMNNHKNRKTEQS